MDKTAIRNFAIEARKILMKSAVTEAGFYGITKEGCAAPVQKGSDFEVYQTLAGTENRIYGDDIKRRANLVKAIQEQGFDQVIEETAYTWFNRIIAIRFMEVNNYLPTRVRVLSSETGSGTPDIITQADTVELNLTANELDRIQTAKRENKYDEAFRLLFIKQCNELNEILPGLFEKTNDYMELLLKITYTGDGVIRMLVDSIPEDNFNVETEGQVEIIGWMYQYYNTELKDDTFAKLKKNVKITKERIPAATQLFTPDWIVRYMVENALGRVWIEHLRAVDSSVDEKAKAEEFGWKYYLPEAEQEADVVSQLVEIRKSYRELTPQDITCIDPCMGSGHILVYMFDVLMDIYRSEGFSEREAVFDILEKNIRGLDIDRRAYQLSYFALMMKARGYNRIFFRGRENLDGERVQTVPQVYAIKESNSINRNQIKYFGNDLTEIEKNDAANQLTGLLDQLKDAKEYGSILKIDNYNWKLLNRFLQQYSIPGQLDFEMIGIENTQKELVYLVKQSELLANKYSVVATNPPYMGLGNAASKINTYVKKYYPNGKLDMYAVFIERCREMSKQDGFCAMITQQSWMFLSSYEKLRSSLLENNIINMAHLGARAFEEIGGEVVQTTSFVLRKFNDENYQSTFCRLVDFGSQKAKEKAYLEGNNILLSSRSKYKGIPGCPIAYWISDGVSRAYNSYSSLGSICDVKNGMSTTDNNRFVRHWVECDYSKIGIGYADAEKAEESKKKWFPYNKGGEFRKWYGNISLVVNWEGNGREIKKAAEGASGGRIVSQEFYFHRSVSWSKVSSGKFALRLFPDGFLFDVAGPGIFSEYSTQLYVMGVINSVLKTVCLQDLYPTMNYEMGQVSSFPILIDEGYKEEVVRIVEDNIKISKSEWDSYESSWDFSKHPLIPETIGEDIRLRDVFKEWEDIANSRIEKLAQNEQRLNEIFINLYDLSDELSAQVLPEEISLRKANYESDIKSLLSYAVGCMFGRYSLSKEGIVNAGSEIIEIDNSIFEPDVDNIIPIADEDYFEDDVVSRIEEFVEVVYGSKYKDENMSFIAKALSNSDEDAKKIIRDYFLNGFFVDHCARYSAGVLGKKPIYWLFSSGKQNGFKCLMYIHRYTKDTLGLIRSDYLTKAQSAIENAQRNAEYVITTSSSAVDRAEATKKRDKYIKQLSEIKYYYQALSHVALQRIEIDLDDGVKTNYSKFQNIEITNEGEKKQTIDLLAKI